MSTAPKIETLKKFFEIRIGSVPIGSPLPYDLYLMVADAPILFRRQGDVVTQERIKALYTHGGDRFLVPLDQKSLYNSALRDIIRDPDTAPEVKGKFIKESAYLHLNDLFTKKDIGPVVSDAQNLVEEMVSFVSSDIAAVSSLMKLSRHDYYTYNHCVDVAVYSIALARRVYGDDKDKLIKAGMGGLLHDIGKRKINWEVINKKSALTPEEWEEVRKHPEYGQQCLHDVDAVPRESKQVVLEHHENFDGTGYPYGLRGDDISKMARVVMIADVFDALTTNRSYHKAMPPMDALNTMFGMQPGKFDPSIFKSFNKHFDKKPPVTLPKDYDPCSPQAVIKKK